MNRRELGVLNELALLREMIARERNIPLKYVLPDDVLVGLVGLRPTTVEELSQLRRLDAGMRKHIGRASSAPSPPVWRSLKTSCRSAPGRSGPARRLVAAVALLINAVAAANDLPAALLVRASRSSDRPRPATDAGELSASSTHPWRRTGRWAALGVPRRGTGAPDQRLRRRAAQDHVGDSARGEPGVGVAPTPCGEGRSM